MLYKIEYTVSNDYTEYFDTCLVEAESEEQAIEILKYNLDKIDGYGKLYVEYFDISKFTGNIFSKKFVFIEKQKKVKIIYGEFAGKTGTLKCQLYCVNISVVISDDTNEELVVKSTDIREI